MHSIDLKKAMFIVGAMFFVLSAHAGGGDKDGPDAQDEGITPAAPQRVVAAPLQTSDEPGEEIPDESAPAALAVDTMVNASMTLKDFTDQYFPNLAGRRDAIAEVHNDQRRTMTAMLWGLHARSQKGDLLEATVDGLDGALGPDLPSALRYLQDLPELDFTLESEAAATPYLPCLSARGGPNWNGAKTSILVNVAAARPLTAFWAIDLDHRMVINGINITYTQMEADKWQVRRLANVVAAVQNAGGGKDLQRVAKEVDRAFKKLGFSF